MGFTVPEIVANNFEPLANGTWNATFVKFESDLSSVKKTPYVQPVFKMDDPEAVRIDGEPFKGNVWGEKFWLSEKAMFRVKKFFEDAGAEMPESGEQFDTLADYAAALTEQLQGTEVRLVVEGYRVHSEDEDLEPEDQRKYTEVAEVLF